MHPMVGEARGILERRVSGQAQLVFLYCGLVGAYLAILLNSAPSYYPNVADATGFKIAVYTALGSFALGLIAYLHLHSLAYHFSEDSQRMEEIAKAVRDEKRKNNMPGLWLVFETYAYWVLSGVLATYSIYSYLSALDQLLKP